MSDNEKIIRSSGNVFADLSLPNPDEEMAKAKLALAVLRQMDARELTYTQAAELMQTTPAHIKLLRRGKLLSFTEDQLAQMLKAGSPSRQNA